MTSAAYMREYRKRTPGYYKKHYQKVEAWRARNREKENAHKAVKNALIAGRILKPDNCVECGLQDNKLEAHHHDYSLALDVLWLCMPCHKGKHNNRGARHGMHKLTEEQAIQIRNSGLPPKTISEQFGISPQTVSDIKLGRSWKHLHDAGIKL